MTRGDEPPRSSTVVDADRRVHFTDDGYSVLPDQTVDDTDYGWGERPIANDDWLLAERPPHWG